MRQYFFPLASKLAKKTPKKRRFSPLFIAITTSKKLITNRKKWVVFFILTLVILPTLPAHANLGAAFEPVAKVFSPLYERFIGKDSPQIDPKEAGTIPPQEVSFEVDDVPMEPSLPISIDSPTPDLLTLLQAEFAIDRDDPQTALHLYKAEALKDNATAVFERALGLSMQLESFDKSLEFAKAWQDKNSDHVPVWFYVTHLAIKSGDYATAVHNLKLILAYDPKADLSQIFAGILPDSLPAQRALFAELQSIDSDHNPSLSVLKSGLLVQLGEHTPAILHLNNAINADKNNLAYRILKADILKDQYPEALPAFLRQSIHATTGETKKQLYLYHTQYLIDQGNLMGAWEVLQGAGELLYQDVEMAQLASLVALDIQRYDDANRLLLALIDEPSARSEAYYYLGVSHERMQDYRGALGYFAKVDDMQYVLSAVKKQVAYELMFDNPEGAIEALVALRQNFEMYASDSYMLQADVLVRLDKKDEAYELLSVAYQEYPDDPALLYAKLGLMDDELYYDDKMAGVRFLLEFDPHNPSYQLAMARLILHKSPDDESAIEMAKSISQMTPDSLDYTAQVQLEALLLLANTAYAQGDYQAVLDYLEMPYELTPDLQVGTLLLRAHQKLGHTQQVQNLLGELQHRFGGKSQ